MISLLESRWRTMIVLYVAGLVALGFVYSLYLGDHLRFPDERDYFSIASNLATKGLYSLDGVHPTAFRPPGYPLILSLLMLAGSNIVVLRLFNYVFLAGTIYFLQKLLLQFFGTKTAIITVILILCYPVLFYAAGTLYPQTFGSFLFVLFIYLLFQSSSLSYKRIVLAGIVIGYLILTISTFIVVFVLTLLFLVLDRRAFATAAVVFILAGVVQAPWIARNWTTFHAFIPFATNSGINLLLGNSPNTTPNSGVNVDLSAYHIHTPNLSEVEKDAYYRSKAVEFITENKTRAVFLYLQKLLNHFNFRNELATKSEASGFKDLVMFLTFYPLLLIVVVRLVLFRRYPFSHIESYFVIVYLLNALFQAVFFTRIRFRLPFDFLLIGIAAIFVSNVLRHHLGAGTAANKQNTVAPFVEKEL